jgi:branched-subunit amino acid transport protein
MHSANYARAMRGWFAGCWVATAVLCAFALVALAWTPNAIDARFAIVVVFLLPFGILVFVVICVLTAIPAAAVISLSEQRRIRSILYFGCAGAVIGVIAAALLTRTFTPRSLSMGMALPYLIAGLAAGLAYWRVAGKYAGDERSDEQ